MSAVTPSAMIVQMKKKAPLDLASNALCWVSLRRAR